MRVRKIRDIVWIIAIALILFGFVCSSGCEGKSVLAYISPSLSRYFPIPVYACEFNLWKDLFKEPFESMYMLCKNGDLYGLTTQTADAILISPEFIIDFLKSKDHEIGDVLFMIHNHFRLAVASEADGKLLMVLKMYGFEGYFGIVATGSGKTRWYK